jgi:hypothetical protein
MTVLRNDGGRRETDRAASAVLSDSLARMTRRVPNSFRQRCWLRGSL